MNTLTAQITEAVILVCPIHGISIGRQDDKSTWRIDFKEEVTDKQKQAAQTVLDEFIPQEDIKPVDRLEALEKALIAKGVLSKIEIDSATFVVSEVEITKDK